MNIRYLRNLRRGRGWTFLFILVIILILECHRIFKSVYLGGVFFQLDQLNETSMVDMLKFPPVSAGDMVTLTPFGGIKMKFCLFLIQLSILQSVVT